MRQGGGKGVGYLCNKDGSRISEGEFVTGSGDESPLVGFRDKTQKEVSPQIQAQKLIIFR